MNKTLACAVHAGRDTLHGVNAIPFITMITDCEQHPSTCCACGQRYPSWFQCKPVRHVDQQFSIYKTLAYVLHAGGAIHETLAHVLHAGRVPLIVITPHPSTC